MKEVKILAIESSCDETAAAVVVNGREALSNVISSQIDLHTLYGGVVPEIASRKHIENINYVIEEALEKAGSTLDDIDAIGVTYGPGLVGALLVGVAEAKAISFAKNIPLVGVHHIEGHICANYVENKELEPPFICLVVSGGHTHLVKVEDYGKYTILGKTRDDAAGETFDKVARAIGLGYPGGPKIDKISKEGNPHAYEFPRAKITDNAYDFSFSGLKSSVLNQINMAEMKKEKIVEAAKSACAHSFIKTLPGGYDMTLSKGAENISQGERQLLTIARAIASDPEIMILDEATSNVDTHTEVLIQKAMAELMKGRTSFVIAHRLSTIRDADMILYMEDGDIKEVGNHEELMKKNGKYAALYMSQFA